MNKTNLFFLIINFDEQPFIEPYSFSWFSFINVFAMKKVNEIYC
jgi:hypothetical protein